MAEDEEKRLDEYIRLTRDKECKRVYGCSQVKEKIKQQKRLLNQERRLGAGMAKESDVNYDDPKYLITTKYNS